MVALRVRVAWLFPLLVAPSCGGRSTLERADASATMVSTGGTSPGTANGGQGGHSPASGGNPTAATGGGTGTAASGGSPSSCRVDPVLSRAPPVLEFLVDSSLSMKAALTAEVSRWKAVQGALDQTFLALDAQSLSGLVFYPNVQLSAGSHDGTTWCFLRYAAAAIAELGPAQRQQLSRSLAAKTPLGATPTHDAYLYALTQFAAAPPAGSRYLVLLTDGAPTYGLGCTGSGVEAVDTGPLVQAAADARARGIDTFVIGLGDEGNGPWMSRLAIAGGTARPGCAESSPPFCHYQVGSAADPLAELQEALLDVRARASSCVYVLASNAAAQLDSGAELVYQSSSNAVTTLTRRDSRVNCEDGFIHAPKALELELCPRSCQAVTSDSGARVSLSLPCPRLR